uniref:Uncharacterized protein n=1 Tax=Phytophthora fragariae TaxID=53985 RepID=A0A6A3FLT3_9STRA|nr:hypothetical protein PF009_g7550 [Phytophthora fragariae]
MIASDDDSESDDSGGLNGEQNSETSDDIIPPDLIDAMDMLRELDQNQHGLVFAGVDPHGAANKNHAPSTALATCGKRLIEEFSSPLSDFETIAQLRDERKRPMETYREYADRLVNMAGSLEGGIKSSTNVRFALDAFVRNA